MYPVTNGICLPVVYYIISQSWESCWAWFQHDLSCWKIACWKQFNKDTVSSERMWYILILKLNLWCPSDVTMFPMEKNLSLLLQSYLETVWEPSPSLCFCSFYAGCVLGFLNLTHFKLLLSFPSYRVSVSYLFMFTFRHCRDFKRTIQIS